MYISITAMYIRNHNQPFMQCVEWITYLFQQTELKADERDKGIIHSISTSRYYAAMRLELVHYSWLLGVVAA